MDNTGLHLQGLCIRRQGQTLVDVDVTIPPGTILTVMGPSGSGKSTLLSMIIGTLDHGFDVRGRVLLNGQDITTLPPELRRIGVLFQDELLFPHLSVGENLAFGLAPTIRGRVLRQSRVNGALADIGLEGFAHRDPATLSGGQRARVALMRMLLAEPAALLLDEPFSKLDADLRAQVRRLVFDRARASGVPALLVTHDSDDAQAAGGPILRLSASQR